MTVRQLPGALRRGARRTRRRGNTALLVGGTGLYHRARDRRPRDPADFPGSGRPSRRGSAPRRRRASARGPRRTTPGAARGSMPRTPAASCGPSRSCGDRPSVLQLRGRPRAYPASPVAQIGITFDAAASTRRSPGRFTPGCGRAARRGARLLARAGRALAHRAPGGRVPPADRRTWKMRRPWRTPSPAASRRRGDSHAGQWRWFRRDPGSPGCPTPRGPGPRALERPDPRADAPRSTGRLAPVHGRPRGDDIFEKWHGAGNDFLVALRPAARSARRRDGASSATGTPGSAPTASSRARSSPRASP